MDYPNMPLSDKRDAVEEYTRRYRERPPHVLHVAQLNKMAPEHIDGAYSMYRTIEHVQNGDSLVALSDESILSAREFCKLQPSLESEFDTIGQQELSRKLKTLKSSQQFNAAYEFQTVHRYDDAERAYRAAINTAPKFLLAYSCLGGMLTDNSRVDDALEVLEEGVDAVGLTCLHAHNLAECYRVLGRYRESLELLRFTVVLGIYDFNLAAKLDLVEPRVKD